MSKTKTEIEKIAEEWANYLYEENSERTSVMSEHDLWDNRKHNFIEGYKAGVQAAIPIILQMATNIVDENELDILQPEIIIQSILDLQHSEELNKKLGL